MLLVNVAFLSDGVGSRSGSELEVVAPAEQRREAARRFCRLLRVNSYRFFDYPDNQFDSISKKMFLCRSSL